MEYKIALAGNPNSGKTTLFNNLTGSTQYVGNWPGVTVEKKDGKLKEHFEYLLMEVMQCGLSWNLMLKKRETFRMCFDDFDYYQPWRRGEDIPL